MIADVHALEYDKYDKIKKFFACIFYPDRIYQV
jgi:hypothetical protein